MRANGFRRNTGSAWRAAVTEVTEMQDVISALEAELRRAVGLAEAVSRLDGLRELQPDDEAGRQAEANYQQARSELADAVSALNGHIRQLESRIRELQSKRDRISSQKGRIEHDDNQARFDEAVARIGTKIKIAERKRDDALAVIARASSALGGQQGGDGTMVRPSRMIQAYGNRPLVVGGAVPPSPFPSVVGTAAPPVSLTPLPPPGPPPFGPILPPPGPLPPMPGPHL